MATIIVLLLMVAVFTAALYAGSAVWLRWGHKKGDASFAAVERGLADTLTSNHVPIRPLLIISSVAGVAALASGFVVLSLLVSHAPRPKKSAPTMRTTAPPALRVIVDDSKDPAMQQVLSRCDPSEIIFIDSRKKVRCVDPNNSEALNFLEGRQFLGQWIHRRSSGKRGPHTTDATSSEDSGPRVLNGINLQGFAIATTPEEVAKTVADRQGIHRYSELIYFVLTFMGVLLRLVYDASRRLRKKTTTLFSVNSLITSLVLAIAVYALVIQTGMSGNAKLITFQTCIFALYNGLLSPALLDFTTLKPVTK